MGSGVRPTTARSRRTTAQSSVVVCVRPTMAAQRYTSPASSTERTVALASMRKPKAMVVLAHDVALVMQCPAVARRSGPTRKPVQNADVGCVR